MLQQYLLSEDLPVLFGSLNVVPNCCHFGKIPLYLFRKFNQLLLVINNFSAKADTTLVAM